MVHFLLLVIVIGLVMAGMMVILHWVKYKRRTARCCHGVNCIRKPGKEGIKSGCQQNSESKT